MPSGSRIRRLAEVPVRGALPRTSCRIRGRVRARGQTRVFPPERQLSPHAPKPPRPRSGSSPRKAQVASRKPIPVWRAPHFRPGRTGEKRLLVFFLRRLKSAARCFRKSAFILALERKLLLKTQDARLKTSWSGSSPRKAQVARRKPLGGSPAGPKPHPPFFCSMVQVVPCGRSSRRMPSWPSESRIWSARAKFFSFRAWALRSTSN